MLVATVAAQTTSSDTTEIKSIIRQQEDAWNRHDWAAFCSHYTEEATLINFVGQFWDGKDNILEHFKLLNACCLEPTSLKFEVRKFRSLGPDLMMVFIEETLLADRDYEVPIQRYKKGHIDYKWRVDFFVRRNQEWKSLSTQMTLMNPVLFPHGS